MSTTQHIRLVMIVKDEAHVLPRCLGALRPHIDSWAIMDTGSTDDTQAVIRKELEGLPGEIHEMPFESFQVNRTRIMELAREDGVADFLLMIDADDTWVAQKGFKWPQLKRDCYDVKLVLNGTAYWRPQVTRASVPWRYNDPAHEVLVCGQRFTKGDLARVHIHCGSDGARRKNEPVKKYERVAAILEKAHEQNPKNARTVFYLAQSYRDARELEKALEFYEKRAAMGGWDEEVWNAMHEIGKLHERLKHPWKEARDAYLTAYSYRPTRAEALVSLASLHRRQRLHALAYLYGKAATEVPYPRKDRLFIEEAAYSWRALDEFAIAAQKRGRYKEAREANLDILERPLGGRQRRRIEANLTWSCVPLCERWAQYGRRITVVLSTYKCRDPESFRDAVDSILGQTYKNFLLLVISDGDEKTPWDALADIDDHRLLRIRSPQNMGQFPVYDAVLAATQDEFLAIQDDDDVSHPERLEKLMRRMHEVNADVVFSDLELEHTNGTTVAHPSNPQWLAEQRDQLVHVGSHVGLWRIESLRKLGGYYGGFPLGCDTMVVGLMAQLGRPAFLRETLYTASRSQGSMTRNANTGIGSPARQKAWRDITRIWKRISNSDDPIASAHRILQNRIPVGKRSQILALSTLIHDALPETQAPEAPKEAPEVVTLTVPVSG